jgi:hypothetical protein
MQMFRLFFMQAWAALCLTRFLAQKLQMWLRNSWDRTDLNTEYVKIDMEQLQRYSLNIHMNYYCGKKTEK